MITRERLPPLPARGWRPGWWGRREPAWAAPTLLGQGVTDPAERPGHDADEQGPEYGRRPERVHVERDVQQAGDPAVQQEQQAVHDDRDEAEGEYVEPAADQLRDRLHEQVH